jgi:tryptophan 2,3-dioxygenase
MSDHDAAVTYTSYLRVDDLLALQVPRSAGPEHDELLFIVVHQVYELWFKQILWELDHVIALLDTDDQTRAGHTLRRVLAILKVMVAQMDVLETMTPLEFLSFRARLDSASGFQSVQFRELEFVLGAKDRAAIERAAAAPSARARLETRFHAPSLWDAFCAHLARRRPGVDAPASAPANEGHDIQAALIDAYRNDPGTAQLCERLVDLDEGVQEWRYRHVKMVERTIGVKPGTGGSSGAGYLRTTLGRNLFPDLWAIRARL